MDFGDAVKTRRTTLSLSQTDLAERAGVSKAMLSEIESGKKNPTLRVACQIAEGLDCQISDLLDLPADVRFQHLTPSERRVLVDAASGAERHLLAPPMVRHGLQVLLYVLPARAEVTFVGDGRGVLGHATCLAGHVRVVVGDDQAELQEDESANYESVGEHALTNLTDEPARVLVVIDSSRRGEPITFETQAP